METLPNDRLKQLEDLVNDEEHEHHETDDSKPSLMLFLIIGIAMLMLGWGVLLFFGVGHDVSSTVTTTLGNHFLRR